jgi:hypothetical protein
MSFDLTDYSGTGTAAAAREWPLLTLRNASRHAREGYVITQWQPIAAQHQLDTDRLWAVRDQEFPPRKWGMPAQVDRIVPDDRSRDQLVFRIDEPVKGGDDEDYRSDCGVRRLEESDVARPSGPTATAAYSNVHLRNDKLELWINTSSNIFGETRHWFGGAVTSLKLEHRFDVLDAIAARRGWPPASDEVRCMQLDRVHLVRPPWDEDGSMDEPLYAKHWRCLGTTSGPVRATATLVCDPFRYTFKDMTQTKRHFTCEVYRTLSLFQGEEWILDDVWVNAKPDDGGDAVDLWFSPRYFMMTQFTTGRSTFRFPSNPGWFAVTCPEDPLNGYGFATDSQAGALWNPPLDWPDRETKAWAFSWELGATRFARSAHIFRIGTNQNDMSDAAGRAWYELMYKPLRAELRGVRSAAA